MSIRNILVAFNGTPTAERAVAFAMDLAKRKDAHVTGLFAHAMPYHYVQMDAYLPSDAMASMEQHERENEARIRAAFGDLAAGEGLSERSSFHTVRGYPNDILSEFARTYDIVVVGQPDSKRSDAYHEPHPDSIAFQAGKPVMVVPANYDPATRGNGAVLAWDGRRAAARALSDAMELLEEEETVTVVHIGTEEEIRQPGRDVMKHLSRHDIHAELVVQPAGGMKIGDLVINLCADTNAGMLVMGAYEHSRFSEMILGGVTRDVMEQTHVPVLIAH